MCHDNGMLLESCGIPGMSRIRGLKENVPACADRLTVAVVLLVWLGCPNIQKLEIPSSSAKIKYGLSDI